MTTVSKLPILESGDRLTRAEFHRRYCARPDIKKAELVEGVVYVASPVRQDGHGSNTPLCCYGLAPTQLDILVWT